MRGMWRPGTNDESPADIKVEDGLRHLLNIAKTKNLDGLGQDRLSAKLHDGFVFAF